MPGERAARSAQRLRRGYTSQVDRELVIAALRARLEREPRLIAAWLFGSAARDASRPDSDVDVAILGGDAAAGTLDDLRLDLQADLSAVIGRDVDLVVIDRAPADLVHRVLRDGMLVTERDRAARIRFEVEARNRYFDMSPIWREYRAPRSAGR
ncbi:MAG: nucleotidyltransferase domain-containing protein [Myxococcota bacterium]|nr:nucleotidyltransferase domain-containing protein [Myxococcota bacterium]